MFQNGEKKRFNEAKFSSSQPNWPIRWIVITSLNDDITSHFKIGPLVALFKPLQGLMGSVKLSVIMVTVLPLLFLLLWQHGGEFKVALSDVLMAWKHLLLDRLHLPPPSSARLENYDLILETYKCFLQRSNTVDLVDIFSIYTQLRLVDTDPEEPVSPVRSCWSETHLGRKRLAAELHISRFISLIASFILLPRSISLSFYQAARFRNFQNSLFHPHRQVKAGPGAHR